MWPFAHHLKVKGHRCVTRHESQQQSSDRLVTDSESQGPRGPRRLPTSGYFPNSQLPNGGPKPPTKNQSESSSFIPPYRTYGCITVTSYNRFSRHFEASTLRVTYRVRPDRVHRLLLLLLLLCIRNMYAQSNEVVVVAVVWMEIVRRAATCLDGSPSWSMSRPNAMCSAK